ncbi:MAG: 30S ribosomal protein S20 [Candidatus Kapaibacterium sp.]|nr:30S ribosomal protein S20 [Bacteroidota bacterium]
MANHASCEKRHRQSKKRNAYNRKYKKMIKDATKAVRSAQNISEAEPLLHAAAKVLDRSAAKGVIHKNTAANRKSSLALHVNRIARGEVKVASHH